MLYLSPDLCRRASAWVASSKLFDEATGRRREGEPQEQFKEFQANNQLLDAEVLYVPFLLDAFDNASAVGNAGTFNDHGRRIQEIAEAIGRLAAWDFSTPTGYYRGVRSRSTPCRWGYRPRKTRWTRASPPRSTRCGGARS